MYVSSQTVAWFEFNHLILLTYPSGSSIPLLSSGIFRTERSVEPLSYRSMFSATDEAGADDPHHGTPRNISALPVARPRALFFRSFQFDENFAVMHPTLPVSQ